MDISSYKKKIKKRYCRRNPVYPVAYFILFLFSVFGLLYFIIIPPGENKIIAIIIFSLFAVLLLYLTSFVTATWFYYVWKELGRRYNYKLQFTFETLYIYDSTLNVKFHYPVFIHYRFFNDLCLLYIDRFFILPIFPEMLPKYLEWDEFKKFIQIIVWKLHERPPNYGTSWLKKIKEFNHKWEEEPDLFRIMEIKITEAWKACKKGDYFPWV